MFDPIDNQKYAELAGSRYDCPCSGSPPLVYGITHLIPQHFPAIAKLGPCVLLTSFSDSCVTEAMAERLPQNVGHWFSNNVMVKHDRVHSIPIGLAFNVERWKMLKAEIEHDPFTRTIKWAGDGNRPLVYVNFTRKIPRNPNPRQGLYEMFGQHPWVTMKGGGGLNSVPSPVFYTDMADHPYTLSPPGAGPDCHRHWEAMALGSIPIVLRSEALSLLEDMPALIVDCWTEVTEEKLRKEWPILHERFNHVCMRKLHMDYWKGVIHGAVCMLRSA